MMQYLKLVTSIHPGTVIKMHATEKKVLFCSPVVSIKYLTVDTILNSIKFFKQHELPGV